METNKQNKQQIFIKRELIQYQDQEHQELVINPMSPLNSAVKKEHFSPKEESSTSNPESESDSHNNQHRKSRIISERKSRSGYKCSRNFLKKMGLRDPESLTHRDDALIRKHRKVIRRFEQSPLFSKFDLKFDESTNLKESGRATISGNNSNKRGNSDLREGLKRTKSNQHLEPAFKNNLKNELVVAIIDRSYSGGKIPLAKWLLVEKTLLECMSDMLGNGGSAQNCSFQSAGWHNGIKVLECKNEATVSFIKMSVAKMGHLWEDAQLDVVSPTNLPISRERITIWIPPPEISDVRILKLLAGQNQEFPVKYWKIVSSKRDGNGGGRDYILEVDEKSMAMLRKSDGRLTFGLGSVRIRICSDDKK